MSAPRAPSSSEVRSLDLERINALSTALEGALLESDDPDALAFLDQLRWLMEWARKGKLTEPVRMAPGYRVFIETNLPGDPVIQPLYLDWWRAVEGRAPSERGT